MGINFYVRIRRENQEHPEEVHIGKASCGWKFLFVNNKDYYEPTRKSINRFLKLHKSEFYDDYGELQDIGGFWDIVDKSSGGNDQREYYRQRLERGECVSHWEKSLLDMEFDSDGLVFTNALNWR